MPSYEFVCTRCGRRFCLTKQVGERDNYQECIYCCNEAKRDMFPSAPVIIGCHGFHSVDYGGK